MGAGKPRSGSLGFYPRVRAAKHLAVFSTYPKIEGKSAKPINFVGYKAGMIPVFGKNSHDKSPKFGLETLIGSTVIECPPVKVFGVRIYGKGNYGKMALGEATVEKGSKHLKRKIKAFKQKGKKPKEEKKYATIEDLERLKEKVTDVVLICETQPSMTGIGKKKPDVFEMHISGSVDEKFAFAKEKFGREIKVSDVFAPMDFIDVKAVDKGKGFQGVVKRFGVKIHRPKSKTRRIVGSIGPWHPPTVMWTVPRAGQMGYQTRTELNKRVLAVEAKPELVNPKSGFSNYGVVKSEYIVVAGSVPGALKRPISFRFAIRRHDEHSQKYADIKLPNVVAAVEEKVKA